MPDLSTLSHEIDSLRALLTACTRRIDDLERQLADAQVPTGDGAIHEVAAASPGPFRIREIPLSEPSSRASDLLQPERPEAEQPEPTDPFAFLNVSPITHAEGPGVYYGVRALLGGLAIARPSGNH